MSTSIFARRLNRALDEKEMSAADLARITGIPESAISNYKRGTYEPKQRRLHAISAALDIEINWLMGYNTPHAGTSQSPVQTSLTPAARRIGHAYEKATLPVRRTVDVALEPYIEENTVCVDFRRSYQTVSAGKGVFLGDEDMTTISVPLDALPKRYERDPDRYFGVPVSGDSMEPKYRDGDILIVSREPLDVGEIGVVVMDGEGYVKQIGKGVLHSLNPRYEDIPINESVHFCGKVVGVMDASAIR